MPETSLSGRSRKGGWTIVKMRGEVTTYDQIAAATIFSMLPVCWAQVLTPLPISDVLQMPSADEEERTKDQRHLCKMLEPTLLALDLFQHQGPLASLIIRFHEYQRIPFMPRDTIPLWFNDAASFIHAKLRY